MKTNNTFTKREIEGIAATALADLVHWNGPEFLRMGLVEGKVVDDDGYNHYCGPEVTRTHCHYGSEAYVVAIGGGATGLWRAGASSCGGHSVVIRGRGFNITSVAADVFDSHASFGGEHFLPQRPALLLKNLRDSHRVAWNISDNAFDAYKKDIVTEMEHRDLTARCRAHFRKWKGKGAVAKAREWFGSVVTEMVAAEFFPLSHGKKEAV